MDLINMLKICHLSSVHQRYDTRIFNKECKTLFANDYSVFFIVSDGKGNEEKNGIKIIDTGKIKSRVFRIIFSPIIIFIKAIKVNANIYHFHDPELLPCGLVLMMFGKKVIYDIHEDVRSSILDKFWIPSFFRYIMAFIWVLIEDFFIRFFTYIFTATPHIKTLFEKKNSRIEVLSNYPQNNELYSEIGKKEWKNELCYVGDITTIRGISNIIDSIENMEVKLNLGGRFESEDFEKYLKSKKGWKNVQYFGFVNRDQYKKILNNSSMGLVLFLPKKNHVFAQPNKIFEYMSAGIPVICSNFSLWKDLVENNNCGICVNPNSIDEIADAIRFLFSNPAKAKEMGINGRNLVESNFNWEKESQKLIEVYSVLSNN